MVIITITITGEERSDCDGSLVEVVSGVESEYLKTFEGRL